MTQATQIRDLRVKTSRPRLTPEEGVALFEADLLELGRKAGRQRLRQRRLGSYGHAHVEPMK